jgi:mannose-1-phosphate guanylyltransferase
MVKTTNGQAFFEYLKQVEKPDLAKAKKYAASWEYLWHAGYKVWHTQQMLNQFKKFAPKVYEGLMTIQKSWGTDNQESVVRKIYPDLEKDSVDYAIFEKMDPKEMVVLPADLGWSDIGAWNILKEELSNETVDNVISGNVIDIDSEDCLIYNKSDNKIIATIGLRGLVVVDTPDGLLVCDKDKISSIKKAIEKIKETKQDKYL